jgi:hypothetical protein
MKRREFIKSSVGDLAKIALVAGLDLSLFSCDRPVSADEHFIVCNGRPFQYPAGVEDLRPVPATLSTVRILNLQKKMMSEMELPLWGHFVAPHPQTPNRVFTSIKWGRHGVEFDFMSGQVLRVIEVEEGKRLMGHGTYARDGKHFFAIQTDDIHRRGTIAVVDLKTYRVVDEISTQGGYPHECKLTPGGDAMYVMTGGYDGASRLNLIRLGDGKLLNSWQLTKSGVSFGHFHANSDGFIIAAGLTNEHPSNAVAAVIDPSGKVSHLTVPEKTQFVGEALSVAVNEDLKLAAITVPDSNCVHVWNYQTQAHIRTLPFARPLGISLSEREGVFVLSEGHLKDSIHCLDRDLASAKDCMARERLFYGDGSHISRIVV